MKILGIDIGGSGIKGAPVDLASGALADERYRLTTPQPATPQAVAKTVGKLVRHFKWQGPVGCGFPAVVQNGVVRTAANIHSNWVGCTVEKLLREATGCPVSVINDADAAGMAEVRFGLGQDHPGVVLMVTIGTGIGSALFVNGRLVPNTELGHLFLKDEGIAEDYAADSVRKKKDLSWKKWAKRFNVYLAEVEKLFWPDMIVLGGGISKRFDNYAKYLKSEAPVKPAALLNEAGIIGAALAVQDAG